MLTHHDDQEFVAGDDWTITGNLLDINGNALDITNAQVFWTFIDPDGNQVADIISNASLTKTNPQLGVISIVVPAQYTQPLLPGRYHDALRVVVATKTTYWMGAILVDCDMFSLLPADFTASNTLGGSDFATEAAELGTPALSAS